MLQHLVHSFPSVEEGNVEGVVAEFGRLLQDACAQAKAEHPGKTSVCLSPRYP